ncbi:MAG: ribonuclease P protein component [Patescibacteria group bacterium]
MLPRIARLHADRDILRVLRQGIRRKHPYLQVTLAAGTARASRAAVVVSKQVSKRATDRNRLRRQVQAVLPKALALLPGPVDALIRLFPPAAKATRNDLIAALRTTWPTHAPTHAPRSPNRR